MCVDEETSGARGVVNALLLDASSVGAAQPTSTTPVAKGAIGGSSKATVLDLCCCGGGWSVGFQQRGHRILAGADNDHEVLSTFAHNFPDAKKEHIDLAKLKQCAYFVNAYKGRVDITLGGSPCQGFSNLNQTEENQKTRSLLPICVKLGIVLGSDVIIMENAPGAKETREMRDAVKALKHNGYSVQCDVLTAADYGVPQKRKRTILVGTRGEWSFTWPATVARHVTVSEALSVPPVPVHGPQVPQEIKEKAEGTRPKSFESAYRTIDVDKPASTVTTQKQMLLFCRGGEFFYPSVAEYLRLQSFPTEFGFPGPVSETKRYEMIGNAVPPKLAAAIAGGLHRRLPSGQVPSPDPDSANAGMAEMVGDLPGRAGERVLVPNPAAVGPSDTPPETQHPIRAPAASCRGRNGSGKGGKGGGGRGETESIPARPTAISASSEGDGEDNELRKSIASLIMSPSQVQSAPDFVALDDLLLDDAVRLQLMTQYISPMQRGDEPQPGLLLYGPPGTGKTALAKAVAVEAGVSLLSISSSLVISMWVGKSGRAMRIAIEQAKQHKPCIVFIDEGDELLKTPNDRNADSIVTNQFKAAVQPNELAPQHVLIFVATNNLDIMDSAVKSRIGATNRLALPPLTLDQQVTLIQRRLEGVDHSLSRQDLEDLAVGLKAGDLRELHGAVRYAVNAAKYDGRPVQAVDLAHALRRIQG